MKDFNKGIIIGFILGVVVLFISLYIASGVAFSTERQGFMVVCGDITGYPRAGIIKWEDDDRWGVDFYGQKDTLWINKGYCSVFDTRTKKEAQELINNIDIATLQTLIEEYNTRSK